MKKKNIIIGLASVIALASLVFIMILVFSNNETKLEKNLSTWASEYYDKEIKEQASGYVNYLGYYVVTVNDLKGYGKDISMFEKKSCDTTDTYAKLTFKEDKSYDVEVHLNCEK